MGNTQSLAPVAKGRKRADQFLINAITPRQDEQQQNKHQRNARQNIGCALGGLTDQVGFGNNDPLNVFIAIILIGGLGDLLLGFAEFIKRFAKIGKAQTQLALDIRRFINPARYRAAQAINPGNHSRAECQNNGKGRNGIGDVEFRKGADNRRKHKRQQKRQNNRQQKTLRDVKTPQCQNHKCADH